MLERLKKVLGISRRESEFSSLRLRPDAIQSPRELWQNDIRQFALDQINSHTIAKVEISLEALYVLNHHLKYIPETWEQLDEMMALAQERNHKGIYVHSAPLGSPPEIAEAWIGCTIPFSSEIDMPLVFVTPELESDGVKSNNGKCYVIDSRLAVEALDDYKPESARAYMRHYSQWRHAREALFFNADCCEVVELNDDTASAA